MLRSTLTFNPPPPPLGPPCGKLPTHLHAHFGFIRYVHESFSFALCMRRRRQNPFCYTAELFSCACNVRTILRVVHHVEYCFSKQGLLKKRLIRSKVRRRQIEIKFADQTETNVNFFATPLAVCDNFLQHHARFKRNVARLSMRCGKTNFLHMVSVSQATSP